MFESHSEHAAMRCNCSDYTRAVGSDSSVVCKLDFQLRQKFPCIDGSFLVLGCTEAEAVLCSVK